MRNAFSIFALMLLGGCVSPSSTRYDLSEVCLTDQGNPVSQGTVYKGKTCSQPHMIMFDGEKTNLEWR